MHLERLILIRHGESVGNEAASVAERASAEIIDLPYRDTDTPLSATGEAQADALGSALGELGLDDRAQIWSSPYRRAAQTALRSLPLAGTRAVPYLDERLRDRELGVLDRLTSHGVAERFPAEARRRAEMGKFYYRPPGGESWADVALRLRSFLADADQAGARMGVVYAHEAVVYLLRYVLEGWDERRVLAAAADEPAPNASVTVMERTSSAPWRAARVGDVSHLSEHGVPSTMHRGRTEARDRLQAGASRASDDAEQDFDGLAE